MAPPSRLSSTGFPRLCFAHMGHVERHGYLRVLQPLFRWKNTQHNTPEEADASGNNARIGILSEQKLPDRAQPSLNEV